MVGAVGKVDGKKCSHVFETEYTTTADDAHGDGYYLMMVVVLAIDLQSREKQLGRIPID
jgi:hypothetical protein